MRACSASSREHLETELPDRRDPRPALRRGRRRPGHRARRRAGSSVMSRSRWRASRDARAPRARRLPSSTARSVARVPSSSSAIAIVWLIGLASTLHPLPPVVLATVALAAGLTIGGIPPLVLGRTLAPLWLAALAIGLSTCSSRRRTATRRPSRSSSSARSGSRRRRSSRVARSAAGRRHRVGRRGVRAHDRLDPARRLARPAGARPARASPTARWPPTRRSRVRRGSRHAAPGATDPGPAWRLASALLVGLLVLAIRHGDRMALAMDARAFGSGPRTHYRVVRWAPMDLDRARWRPVRRPRRRCSSLGR